MRLGYRSVWIELVFLVTASAIAPAAGVPSNYTTTETRGLMYDYAKCVVAKHWTQASQALLLNVDNQALQREYAALVDGACLVQSTHADAKMSFAGDLYRYALADALVEKEFASRPPPDLSDVPRLSQRPLPKAPLAGAGASKVTKRRYQQALKDYQEAKAFDFLASYGECVVRVGPAEAKALLGVRPASADEGVRFEKLRPALAQCLPENAKLEFGKVALRGSIALNYYRLSHAPAIKRLD